jgi:excisionase family DNA binding protein
MAKKSAGRGNARPADLASIPGIKRASEIPAPERKGPLSTPAGAEPLTPRVVELRSATSRLPEYTMTVAEAAEFLGIGESTLRKYADAEEIHHARIGKGQKRKFLFRRSDLERYLESSVEIVGSPAPIPVDAIPPDDLQTNPAIEEVYAQQSQLFHDWTPADWRELYSLHGDGGSLTSDGVIAAAEEINRLRDVRHKFEAVIRGEHGKALTVMIDGFYADQTIKQKQRR